MGIDNVQLKEFNLITQLTSSFRRHPNQLNTIFGSDSEILKLTDSDEFVVALSTDGIVEEIVQGIYRDPFLIGWMTVMVNLSDLAAVGARAEGILIQLCLPHGLDEGILNGIRDGIQAACSACETYVLGGDINHSEQLSTSGTAFGVIPAKAVISRIGCQSGEFLYTTGQAGLGAAYAFTQAIEGNHEPVSYQPFARLKEGQLIRQFASACLDTSDGLIPGLAQLAAVNDVGFKLTEPYSKFVHPEAQDLTSVIELPQWIMLAGPHGDFELVFSVPPDNVVALETAAQSINWEPILLGSVTRAGLMLDPGTGDPVRADASQIANLFDDVNGDPEDYLIALQSFHRTLLKRTK